MKKLKIFSLSIILCILVFAITSNACYAETPTDIKSIAEKELKHKSPALNADKKHFGLDDLDDVNNATLGEGYPYHIINNPIIKNMEANPQSASIDQLFVFDGYVFPIRVGSKAAGLMFLKQIDGKWDAFQISSNLSFENDMKEAKSVLIKLKKQPSDNVQNNFILLYDNVYAISGLAKKSLDGEYFIPIKKNGFLDINKNEVKALPEITSKIAKVHKEKNLDSSYRVGGISNIDDKNDHVKNYKLLSWLIAAVIISCVLVTIPLRKRHNKVNFK